MGRRSVCKKTLVVRESDLSAYTSLVKTSRELDTHRTYEGLRFGVLACHWQLHRLECTLNGGVIKPLTVQKRAEKPVLLLNSPGLLLHLHGRVCA